MATIAFEIEENIFYDTIMFACLALSLVSISYITIYNYIRGGYAFLSYEEMVKKKLDNTFEKFNHNDNGIEWYVVPGHYWLELRIKPLKKKNDKPKFSEDNMPVAVKERMDVSNIQVKDLLDYSNMRNAKPKPPVYNNMMRDEKAKPDIFSNPLSSVHNE